MASHESQPRRQNSHAARVKERESHVRRPRKKSKAPLIVGLILAIFVLAAVIALLWIESNCVLVGGKLYRQGDTIDLRSGEVSIAEYDELRARFPDSVILWNVPIGSRSFDSSSTSVSVDNYSEAEIDSFRYLPQLKTIDASDADCYDVIMKTIDAYPNCTVKYQVKLGGSAYAGDTAQLVLYSPAALSELEARLQYFPQLESVDLRAAGLGDDEEDALIDAFPDISFLREVELAGKSFDTSAAELDLSGTDIDVQTLVAAAPRFTGTETVELGSRELSFDDIEAVRDAFGGAAVHCKLRVYGTQVDSFAEELNYNGQYLGDTGDAERAASVMPYLRKLYMDNCGLSDEVLGALDDKFENLRVVWTVYIKGFPCKTDADNFCVSKYSSSYGPLGDDLIDPIKYCKDMVTLDLGHMDYTNLNFVKNMKHLKYLICGDTKVTDISALADLEEIYFIEMFLTPCSDFSVLANCKSLRHLNICYCPVADYTQLKELSFLDRLWVKRCGLTDEQIAEIQEACPNTWIMVDNGDPSSVCYDWRCDDSYFDMRDNLGMFYMVAKPAA